MPIYEYACEWCGGVIERFFPVIPRSIPEQVVDVCDHGGQGTPQGMVTFKRVMSKPTFHLKGGGWAKDGYVDPKEGLPGKGLDGEDRVFHMRKRAADPEHPWKYGDYLKKNRRGDDFSDL